MPLAYAFAPRAAMGALGAYNLTLHESAAQEPEAAGAGIELEAGAEAAFAIGDPAKTAVLHG